MSIRTIDPMGKDWKLTHDERFNLLKSALYSKDVTDDIGLIRKYMNLVKEYLLKTDNCTHTSICSPDGEREVIGLIIAPSVSYEEIDKMASHNFELSVAVNGWKKYIETHKEAKDISEALYELFKPKMDEYKIRHWLIPNPNIPQNLIKDIGEKL